MRCTRRARPSTTGKAPWWTARWFAAPSTPCLAPDASRSTAAWAQLNIEQNSAKVAVQHSLAGSVKLPRNMLRTALQLEIVGAAASVDAVLVIGESGTGKSALTLSAVEQLATAYEGFEYVALNLRRTRDSVAALPANHHLLCAPANHSPVTHIRWLVGVPIRPPHEVLRSGVFVGIRGL